MTIFIAVILFLLGSSIASFAAVAVERPMRKEKISFPASHCACGRTLKWHENIPVFGWLKSRGKTKCCDSTLPKRYVITEFALGLFFASLAPLLVYSLDSYSWGPSGWLAVACGIVGIGIIVAVLTLLAIKDKVNDMTNVV